MKTITLRMSDIEADALDRIAYLNGMSKNKMLCALIASEYERFCPDAVASGEIFMGINSRYFPDEVREAIEAKGADPTEKENAAIILKCYNYALENPGECPQEMIAKLEEEREEFIMRLKGI